MREIKFRAWDKRKNEMVEPQLPLGSNLCSLNEIFEAYQHYVWMQYTGLKDKNGKEIWEGDIVKAYSFISEEDPELNECTIHQVKYMADSDYPAFDLEPWIDCDCNGLSWAISDIDSCGIEVIGNIWENSELLKKDQC